MRGTIRTLFSALTCGLLAVNASAQEDVSTMMRAELDAALSAYYGGMGASDARYCVEQTDAAIAAAGGADGLTGDKLALVRDALTARFTESQTYTCGALAVQMFFVFPPSEGANAAQFASTVGVVVDSSMRSLEQATAPDPVEAGIVRFSQGVVTYLAGDLRASSDQICNSLESGFAGASSILEAWPETVNCPALAAAAPPSPAPAPAPVSSQPAPSPNTAGSGHIPAGPTAIAVETPPAAPASGHLATAPGAPAPATPSAQPPIESAASPMMTYKNCRKISLDYEDADGNPAVDTMVMCQDETGEFVEVEGLE